MLVNLLPGLREIRAPLISGYLWLAFLFLAFHDDLPSRSRPGSALRPLFEVGDSLSTLGIATATGVAAYLVGSAMQELWKLLGRSIPSQRPLYGEAGIRTSPAGRLDIAEAVRIRVLGVKRQLFEVALAPGEKGIDVEPTAEAVERELPLVRTLLLGERPELIGELDRFQAEADLRITVAFSLAFLAVLLAIESSPGWIAVLAPAALLLVQGYQRQLEAGDLLAKALRIGKANTPALEALASSAKAVLQRVELEGKLRQAMDGGNGIAAFRLGNLQASWDDFEAAIGSFEVAVSNGVFRAYSELGRAHERRGDKEKAERAYRDGAERGDQKAIRLLAELLSSLDRDEEARETAGRVKEAEGDLLPAELPGGPPVDRVRAEGYRKRIEGGDAKAAINLGMLLARQKDRGGAVEAFERATALDDSDAQAWLQLGEAKSQLGLYLDARAAFERTLALREQQLGPRHLEAADARERLGVVLMELGLYEEALHHIEEARRITEAAVGKDNSKMFNPTSHFGNVVSLLGGWDAAIRIHEEALALAEATTLRKGVALAIALGNLGHDNWNLGNYERAKELGERALEVKERLTREKILAPDHPRIALSLDNIGSAVDSLGEHEQAIALFTRALAIEEKELGAAHPRRR